AHDAAGRRAFRDADRHRGHRGRSRGVRVETPREYEGLWRNHSGHRRHVRLERQHHPRRADWVLSISAAVGPKALVAKTRKSEIAKKPDPEDPPVFPFSALSFFRAFAIRFGTLCDKVWELARRRRGPA